MRLVVVLLILGFPVALILSWAFEITPEGIKRAENVQPNESIPRKAEFGELLGVTIALAVIAAGLLGSQFLRPKSAPGVRATPVSLAIPENSIAVLPFENLTATRRMLTSRTESRTRF